jgi:mono/diheme cytochrome c family protein
MRQSLVNRSVIALSSLLVLACAGFAWVVEHPPRAAPEPPLPVSVSASLPGERIYEARCARCHDIDEGAGPLIDADDPKQARAELLAFLTRHRKSDPAENAAIVEYLEAAVAGQAEPATEDGRTR